MLRASGQHHRQDFSLQTLTDDRVADTGVPACQVITDFVDALVRQTEALPGARTALSAALGPEAVVDAAAVAAQFQMMNRVADATGVPVDGVMEIAANDLQRGLDLHRYPSSANTADAGVGRKLMQTALGPLARAAMPHLGRLIGKKPKR